MPGDGRFKKGVSGNPKGRPKKGQAITDLLEEYLLGTDKGDKVDRKRKLVEEMARRAFGFWADDPVSGKREYVRGSDTMLQYLVDRHDGKARQSVELLGERDLPPIVVQLPPDPDAKS